MHGVQFDKASADRIAETVLRSERPDPDVSQARSPDALFGDEIIIARVDGLASSAGFYTASQYVWDDEDSEFVQLADGRTWAATNPLFEVHGSDVVQIGTFVRVFSVGKAGGGIQWMFSHADVAILAKVTGAGATTGFFAAVEVFWDGSAFATLAGGRTWGGATDADSIHELNDSDVATDTIVHVFPQVVEATGVVFWKFSTGTGDGGTACCCPCWPPPCGPLVVGYAIQNFTEPFFTFGGGTGGCTVDATSTLWDGTFDHDANVACDWDIEFNGQTPPLRSSGIRLSSSATQIKHDDTFTVGGVTVPRWTLHVRCTGPGGPTVWFGSLQNAPSPVGVYNIDASQSLATAPSTITVAAG